MTPARRPVIAVGVDAAERRLVERLSREGRLPTIAALAAESGWGTVTSPASLGSGAVWPTFTTGEPPALHGVFGEYGWDPARMAIRRTTFDHLDPFWRRMADAGTTIAVVDVPFAPIVGHPNLIEIADWGAHDWSGEGRRIRPASIEASLADVLSTPHPLTAGPVDSAGPVDVAGLRDVARGCLAGVRLRGDLAVRLLDVASPDLLVVVFPELHRASHLLWHTIDPAHPVWRETTGPLPDDVMGGLSEVLVAIDQQMQRLLAHGSGPRAALLFSLHGMQPARGIPACLDDMLEQWGFAVRRSWWRRSAGRHGSDLLRAGKRGVPETLKTVYYRRVPRSLTRRLSQPAVPVPDWDWRRTRAFALPSDQHGWIRINVAGREAGGIVRASDYRATCDELQARLLALASPEGALVRAVTVTAPGPGDLPALLPDLVVHWSPATWRPRFRVLEPPLDVAPIGLKFVGQHADDGFFVGTGLDPAWPTASDATTIGTRIEALLGR